MVGLRSGDIRDVFADAVGFGGGAGGACDGDGRRKRFLPDCEDGRGNGERGQAAAVVEGVIADGGDGIGNIDLLQVDATAKSIVPDFLYATGKAKLISLLNADPDGDIDTLKLPHSVDCKPFPVPQQAKYGEERVSLANMVLKTKVIGNGGQVIGNDPIVRLLKKKLGRFGTKFVGGQNGRVAVPGDRSGGATVIEIVLSPNAPVEKPQGYSLDVAKGMVRIRARTRLGLTWGVVSLLQCIDRKTLAVRECVIRDWPRCERRGVIDYWVPDFLEFALFTKMSSITFNMGRDCILDPLDRERYRLVAKRYHDFGIEVYFHIRDIAMKPLLPLSSPRTWELQLERAKFIASTGAGISFHLDDHRFPMPPEDLKAYGTAANIDAKYMTRLYRAVKAEYPNAIMQYCPPFYWGPDGGVAYPEDRDEYLKSIARDLDPEIDVYWTGPRVKTHFMTVEKTKWYSDLIGRKPTIFHNGNAIGQHHYIQYGADPTGYKKSHAPEIFDLIASFQQNMSHYSETCEVGSCMDWCWNPDAHDGTISVRRTVEQFEGPGVFEIIADATPSLAYFDKYRYCTPRAELLDENLADLDKRVADSDAAWANVLKIAKNGGKFVDGFKKVTGWAHRLANWRRKPTEALIKEYAAAKANIEYAQRETGYDEAKGDQFIPAELLVNGRFLTDIKDAKRGKGRSVKMLETGMEVNGKFTCEPFPNPRPFKFLIAGMRYLDRWERPPKVASPQMEVEVNGRVVWRGEMFKDDIYRIIEVEVPVDAIQRANVFKIRNPGPYVKDEGRPVIHYVVIRK